MAWKERGIKDSRVEVRGGGGGVELGVETDQLGLLGVEQRNWLSRCRAADRLTMSQTIAFLKNDIHQKRKEKLQNQLDDVVDLYV
jgi:hypothetical protein